ncbi:MAG: GNAT family N-acetyltransferase [Marinicella sp.]
MNVRKASTKDLSQLAELFDGYRQFYQQDSDLNGAKSFLAERLKNHESIIFVAELNKQLLGFTQLFPSFSSVSMQRLWVLNDLFVANEARQQGVAEKLMSAARNLAQDTGSKGLILETDLDNTAAQKLYDKLGYVRENSTQHYFLANDKL